jgi:predicted nucleic acid-binding protein
MPIYHIAPLDLDFSRRAIILDTNILVAAFNPRDQKHDDAKAFLDMIEDPIIVPVSVVIEAWGVLVGGSRSSSIWRYGFELLAWVTNPGYATLILQNIDSFNHIQEIMKTMHVDCVDACIMRLGHEMSDQCNLKPSIRIATYDTADFLKCIKPFKLRIVIHNPNTLDEEGYELI